MNTNDVLKSLRAAAKTADDKKAENILILDVRPQSSVADFFLLISGTSHVHIRALEDAIRETLRGQGADLRRTDGQRGHLWRALDYGHFIVHIMDPATREFYAIERLWERGKPVAWKESVKLAADHKPKRVRVVIEKKPFSSARSSKKKAAKSVKKAATSSKAAAPSKRKKT